MKIIELGTPEALPVLEEIKNEIPVLLVGSAISSWKPTCLPTGSGFSQEIFNLLFPEQLLPRQSSKYHYLQEIYSKVPFEHIFERCPCVHKIAPLFKDAFAIRQFNPVQEVLAKSLLTGKVLALVTTNYDLCFDTIFNQQATPTGHSIIRRVIMESDAPLSEGNLSKIYFKIHGSADDIAGETLVFTLRHESILPKWKRDLLVSLLTSKSLMVIGYSGLDFEICPEILRISLKKLWWNGVEANRLTPNAKRVLEAHKGVFLQGDLRELCSALFSPVNAEFGNPSLYLIEAIQRQLDQQEILEWRLALLNSMGCPDLAIKTSEDYLNNVQQMSQIQLHVIRQKAQALFHLGKYRDSARTFVEAAKIARSLQQVELEAKLFLDSCEAYRCYGSLYGAYKALNLVEKLSKRIHATPEWISILGRMTLRRVFLMRPFFQMAEATKVRFIQKLIARAAEQKLRLAASYALQTGSWFDFQQARFWAERLGIDPNKLAQGEVYAPPPPKEGYDHLGYHVAQSMYFRDLLLKAKPPISRELRAELHKHLGNCRQFGNFPEIWKLLLLLRKKDRQSWNAALRKEFLQAFFFCQYRLWMRVFQLATGG